MITMMILLSDTFFLLLFFGLWSLKLLRTQSEVAFAGPATSLSAAAEGVEGVEGVGVAVIPARVWHSGGGGLGRAVRLRVCLK